MIQKALGITFGVALMLAMLCVAPPARADEANQATRFTFNQPIEIPGNVVLPAGTYWFMLPDDAVSPSLVRIFNADQTDVVAAFLTVPVVRPDITAHSELTFERDPKDSVDALTSWYYPDRLTGHEFIYSPNKEALLSENPAFTVLARPATAG